MTNTERHALPQWEKDDRILMEDFNAAMTALDAAIPKIDIGYYTGDGASKRTIELPFTPKAVLVVHKDGKMTYTNSSRTYYYGGLAVTGRNSYVVEITTNGFVVYYQQNNANYIEYHTNDSGAAYCYIAIG